MLRHLIISLISFVSTGCDTPGAAPMARDAACHEQANAWCESTGFAGSPGCRTWYVHECEPSGPNGPAIAETAQNGCLQAIADGATAEPEECMATWE